MNSFWINAWCAIAATWGFTVIFAYLYGYNHGHNTKLRKTLKGGKDDV